MKKGCFGKWMQAVALLTCAFQVTAVTAASEKLSIPPRLQWNANFGYCGEVSLISAGLYYGQYMSQYDARIAAIGGAKQSRQEMLLGSNATKAASNMHLTSVQWRTFKEKRTGQFLRWVKGYVEQGCPVIIGVFTNENRFYGNPNPRGGDPQYDHIVPVNGFRSGGKFADDRITFSDNGLWGSAGDRPYYFTYRFGDFARTREAANAPDAPVYSLPAGGRNYGIAIIGIMDRDGDTLPVRVATNVNFEKPNMVDGSNARPAPMPLLLTITVSGLQPGVVYKVYRYRELKSVPDFAFNANSRGVAQVWDVTIPSGSTFTFTQQIMSDEIAVYRAVRATAP